jgi:carboxylesterase type B
MVSPMSKGLFNKAMALSGSIASQLPIQKNLMQNVKYQASVSNCSTENITEMVECLKRAPLNDFTMTITDESDKLCNILIWFPVIENDFGQERFLTDDPSKLFQSGEFHRVPIIAGVVRDEFISISKSN